jgi:hypothetical protein
MIYQHANERGYGTTEGLQSLRQLAAANTRVINCINR